MVDSVDSVGCWCLLCSKNWHSVVVMSLLCMETPMTMVSISASLMAVLD